jgi:hypothetical protein
MPLSVSYRTMSSSLLARVQMPMETVAYLRGDALLVLAPLLPKPPVDPNDPNAAQQPQQRPNGEPGMDPGMDPGMEPGMQPGLPGGLRRSRIPTQQAF